MAGMFPVPAMRLIKLGCKIEQRSGIAIGHRPRGVVGRKCKCKCKCDGLRLCVTTEGKGDGEKGKAEDGGKEDLEAD